MTTIRIAALVLAACSADVALAQAPAGKWKTPAKTAALPKVEAKTPAAERPADGIASLPSLVLPGDHGQYWHEYDLSPYTSKITDTQRPEQAVVDWILRETGPEVWFSQPLGLMSADRRKLKVYHTREMHAVVAETVERFTASPEPHVLGLSLLTVGNPGWRSKAHTLLKPVSVQTPGIEAWLTSKENAAVLLGELKKRPDAKEQNSPSLVIHNGQSQTISRMRPRTYSRLSPGDASAPPGQVESGQIDEGFSLQISPLLSIDGKTADVVIKCQIDQVERLLSVYLESANPLVKQRTHIQVPQIVSWRLHERFRWPSDQVLVLSCGVVAAPAPEKATALGAMAASPRADALLVVEYQGKAPPGTIDAARGVVAPNNRGRY